MDDPWHYARDELALRYFDQFDSGLSHAAVIFGPRRTGETEFLLKDLGPLPKRGGYAFDDPEFARWIKSRAP